MKNIQAFDISNIKKTSKIIIIGKRASGKTTLIKNIVTNIDDEFTNYIIFDPVLDHISTCNRSIIYETYDENILKNNIYDNKVIIIDNALCTQKDNKNIEKYFIDNETGIILSNSSCLLLSNLISNTDFIFIFRELNQSSQNHLYNKYFTSLFTLFDFIEFFNAFLLLCETSPYACLVIAKTNNLSSKLFIFNK